MFSQDLVKAAAELSVVPLLEDKVEEFERAANNAKKLTLFSLSAIIQESDLD